MVRRSLQTLIPSSPSTTSSGAKAPATGRTWFAAPCKPLFLRRRAPRLLGTRPRQRAGRGAPLSANHYSFVTEHHVFRGQGAGGGSDVVRRSPQTLIPSSPGTTSSEAKAPATGRTWCAAPRKPLFFRRRAPRLPGPRRRWRAGRGAPRPANPYSFVTGHHVFRVQGAGVGVARRWNMASRGARRQHGRLWGETNLRLGAKETEDQGFAGIHAPSPRRPRAGRFRFFISNSMTFLRIRKN